MEMLMEKPIEAEEGSQKSDTRTSRIPKVLRFYSVKRFNDNAIAQMRIETQFIVVYHRIV
ncbi:hypothetical protein T03_4489 [Trichinella britovi]|uniref:Uncharacterized protein n=1 Tax=Trichinella britovi TaxID=45882 RepID=A0A0V1C5D0_TRIBR|nr:hypothetical protein T03_4489 [Trichinella britovi]